MTRTLTTADVEPADKTVWITANGELGVVRADAAKRSSGANHWYGVWRESDQWVTSVHGPASWTNVGEPVDSPQEWPLTEGPSDLHDLVMREVGR